MDDLSEEFIKYLVDFNHDGEGDRQLTLMALAHLAVERPGFDYALNLIACRIDNVEDGRAKLYDQFKALHSKPGPKCNPNCPGDDTCEHADVCMCGDYMKDHGYNSGHSPVSMHDYNSR